MKLNKLVLVVFAVMIIGSMILAACAPAATPETPAEPAAPEATEAPAEPAPEPTAPAGPVTFYGYSTTDIPTLDPQLGEDVVSINYIENLFVNLTNYDLDTAEVVPEAATSWEVSDDGMTYTFHLRTDIPWVKHNPVTGETIQEVDADGNPRFVTAYDFEYGIKRACDPGTGSYYSSIIAPNIVGCEDVLYYEDPEAIPAELVDAIGVTAVDDATLVIELPFAAAYFLSMTPMWTITATPQWAIEEHGADWIEAGNIVTNGRYVLQEWVHGVRRIVVRNPLMPADMQGGGNIEQFITNVVPDATTGYALWLNNEVETSGIPDAELENHLVEFADETVQIPDLAVFYIAFRMTKPPFDNVHVRRAFSAAFDRATFVEQVRQGQGLPMKHFAPPGIFGAPPIDEVGVGYDPEFAKAELEAAGYPNCEGFPQVSLLGYSGQSTLNWIEFAQANWAENLGCSPDLITIEQQSFSELLATTKLPDEEAPNMWTLGWGPDYADENNWVADVLSCQTALRMKRECNEIDDLLDQARTEPDPEKRIALYAQIEDMFFGTEGEFPFMPIFLRIAYVAEHSWLTRTPALFGGQQWYTWSIDQEAQLAARGE
ncbi:MAG: peptide ABC transporter substrate-binding protein [Chloroflexi bacterium]|nr:peptide ABC transporter substrate-binding protein [Chloroflexota bacterium]